MSDIVQAYGDLNTVNDDTFDGLLEAFENAGLTSMDLEMMEPQELVTRTQRSINEINRFLTRFLTELNIDKSLDFVPEDFRRAVYDQTFTSGDAKIDTLLQGGFKVGSICEIAGESASGKSNLLIQSCVTVQLPVQLRGLDKSAIYISTESGFETRRMHDMLETQYEKHRATWPDVYKTVNSSRIYCLHSRDQEELEHVLYYQVAEAVKRYGVGLVVIDSIAGHYRAELDQGESQRIESLMRVTRHLRFLAANYGLAILLANQVTDRFARVLPIDFELDTLHVDYQSRWFSGWTDRTVRTAATTTTSAASVTTSTTSTATSKTDSTNPVADATNPDQIDPDTPSQSIPSSSLSSKGPLSQLANSGVRAPALGLTWSSYIDERIVLKREECSDEIHRTLELVFSPFLPWNADKGIQFEIVKSGVQSVGKESDW